MFEKRTGLHRTFKETQMVSIFDKIAERSQCRITIH